MSPTHRHTALPPPTPEALLSLVTPIPPKILHAYVLAHIPDSPQNTLAALASFFGALKPPPLLHCVRCHADYMEVDNDDRSCRMPHDLMSANPEWVGPYGRDGCEYETCYDCCDRTVDGDFDISPPDGWCYEGMHTTDVKRARFRADSTESDDMLDTCIELNCPNARVRRPKKNVSNGGPIKRRRPSPLEDDIGHDFDDCGFIGTEAFGVQVIARVVGQPSQTSKGKGDSNNKSKEMVGIRRQTKAVAVRSQSRVRLQAPSETASNEASKKAGSSRGRGRAAEMGDEKTMTDSEGKVRKRRKVAARAAA